MSTAIDHIARAAHFEANWRNAEAVIARRDERIKALDSTLTEAIRRLKLAMRAAGPRRGLGYKDLQAVLDAPATAPRPWEIRDAEKAQSQRGTA